MAKDFTAVPAANLDALGVQFDTLAEAVRLAQPTLEAMRMFDNTALRELVKPIKLPDTAALVALGQVRETQNLGRLLDEAMLPRNTNLLAASLAAFESNFVLPKLGEVSRLVAAFEKSPLSKLLGAYERQGTQLQRVLEQITTPWLHAEETMRSIAGFAELHGLSKVLGNATGFDEGVAAVLRTDLGDWRDQISWPSDIFTDLEARTGFYAELGFNHELTAFPAEAFHEGLGIVGLRREPPPLLALYGTPVPVETDDEREEAFVRTNAAHDWLQRLESHVRAFINEQMTACFGPDWPKHRLPNGMYDQWRDKKRADREASAADRSLISYADFTDYIEVICRRDNWREVFEVFFRRRESVRESFQRLYPIRLDTMHARPITQDDELLLFVETRRLMKIVIRES